MEGTTPETARTRMIGARDGLVSLLSNPSNIHEDNIDDMNIKFQSLFDLAFARLNEESPNYIGIEKHLLEVGNKVDDILIGTQGALNVVLRANRQRVEEVLDTVRSRSAQSAPKSRVKREIKTPKREKGLSPLLIKQQAVILAAIKNEFIDFLNQSHFNAAVFYRKGNDFFTAFEEYKQFLVKNNFEVLKLTALRETLHSVQTALAERKSILDPEEEGGAYIEKFERKIDVYLKQFQKGISITLGANKVDVDSLSDAELRQTGIVKMVAVKNMLENILEVSSDEGFDELFTEGASLIIYTQERCERAIRIRQKPEAARVIEREFSEIQKKLQEIRQNILDIELAKRFEDFMELFQLKKIAGFASAEEEIHIPTPEDVACNTSLIDSNTKIAEAGDLLVDDMKRYLGGKNETGTLENVFRSFEKFQFAVIVRLILILGRDMSEKVSKLRVTMDEYKNNISHLLIQKGELELNSRIEKLFNQIHVDINARWKKYGQTSVEKPIPVIVAEKKPRENPMKKPVGQPGGPTASRKPKLETPQLKEKVTEAHMEELTQKTSTTPKSKKLKTIRGIPVLKREEWELIRSKLSRLELIQGLLKENICKLSEKKEGVELCIEITSMLGGKNTKDITDPRIKGLSRRIKLLRKNIEQSEGMKIKVERIKTPKTRIVDIEIPFERRVGEDNPFFRLPLDFEILMKLEGDGIDD